MEANQIISEWKKGKYHPLYWFEGDESYLIDQLVDAAEQMILKEEERAFNQVIHYGKDSTWNEVMNSCMRYPMFAEKQLVILKEAQQLKDIEKLESYFANPLSSTILIVAYKEKKIDGRSKFAKLIQQKTVYFSASKIKDAQLPVWIQQYLHSKGYAATEKAIYLLADHIGNDLSRITNELEKLFIHAGERKKITEDDVEECIGISKEYNLFEFQHAIGKKNFSRSIQILQYFEHNPKAAPVQLILPVLYSYFSKVYMLASAKGDDKTIASQTGINNWFLKDYKQTAGLYGYEGIEAALLLLHEYNLKSVGVNAVGMEDADLLKELLSKLMYQR